MSRKCRTETTHNTSALLDCVQIIPPQILSPHPSRPCSPLLAQDALPGLTMSKIQQLVAPEGIPGITILLLRHLAIHVTESTTMDYQSINWNRQFKKFGKEPEKSDIF